ncbi:unnamed protein product [Vicia faba]|uniref:Coilin n=1 Tax=Vicia faba TaxID=3906 RepID=A0AAV0ZHP5_VICFA|nr:unnamed protein product [Vicia faba]
MTTAMTEKVRLRLFFDDPNIISKSKTKQGLNRCWFLLEPHLTTISDLASRLQTLFRLHRTSPAGVTLSMDGFVLPPFVSTCILRDKDIVCVRRKGSRLTDSKPAMLQLEARENQTINALNLLAIEGVQEERREPETVSLDDDDDDDDDNDQSEDVVYVESKSDGNTTSKKRKASKKLKSPSQKKIKMSTTDNLSVIPEVNDEENGSFKDHQPSPAKKSSKKLSKKSNNLDLTKQKDDKNGSISDETRSLQPQREVETKKLPSRSARRKKAKRKWLRELKLEKKKEKEKDKERENENENGNENEKEKEKVLEKDDQQLPIKDKNDIVADVHQQSDEESEAEDDMVPVEIKPGHIRFQPRGKDQAVPENQFPVDTFQWSGTTSKKKGQKWGKERTSSHKQDDYEQPRHDFPIVQNAGKKHTFDAVDFDKLTPYTDLPKEGIVIAYRLIELSESWTPEISSFRVGKVTEFDSKSNRIWLETVSEFPFDFRKKIDDLDDDTTPAQYDPSPYQEDGSLEIDYVSLADVRIIKNGHSNLATVVASNDALATPTKATNTSTDALVTPTKATNTSTDALVTPTKATNNSTDEKRVGNQTPVGSSKPQKEGHTPAKENGEINVWDEINEALKAKKARLLQGGGWKKDDSSSNRPWSQRAKCSALGPTMALLRSQNGFKK